ncbi:hypothetical protein E3N88_23182 [Mikania micrantha]|uniref:Bidirectional sugar transporter SWEET n=1 Tax=Mikania micrantha TaxID=192012 RepID=A0A5N6NCK0_9ASTR|nr:hypothetical protein E3N88_23182 [Mikania micrantha]
MHPQFSLYKPSPPPFLVHRPTPPPPAEASNHNHHRPPPLLVNLSVIFRTKSVTMVIAGQFPHLTFAFGLMGNIVSFMVFLSPLPTFYKVYKKKSTEGFQSIPYVVGLFSAMLWIYYALLKGNAMLLITINSVGIVVQTFYLCVFIFYAPKKARVESLKLIMLLIVTGFGLIVFITQFLTKGAQRGVIVGWICLIFSLCVFVAPLGVVKQVIKTKSVEYMPILLSLALTLSAVMWFFYGLLLGDFNIAIPNTLGFTFGIIQIILYFVYKNKKSVIDQKITEHIEKTNEVMNESRGPEVKDQNIIDMVKLKMFIHAENIPNPHDVAVVRSPIVANHTIEVTA